MAKPYQILANLLALFAIVYVGVDSFYRIVGGKAVIPQALTEVSGVVAMPTRNVDVTLTDYTVINKRNIFGASAASEADVGDDLPSIEVLVPTSLKLTLLGTIGASNGDGRAIIRDDTNKKQNIYREGDAVQGALIMKIIRGKVVLRVDGRDEILTMKKSADTGVDNKKRRGVTTKKGGVIIREMTISRRELDAMKANLSNLLTSVEMRPYIRDGKRLGMIITRMKRGSGLGKLGLQKGDVIKTVNNKGLKGIGDALLLYEKLKSGGKVSLELIRRGKSQQIRYTLI